MPVIGQYRAPAERTTGPTLVRISGNSPKQTQATMKTNLLKSFVAVAEARSFSRAAREIHLSQSAVSKHIARLETECGARLVARSGLNVECTPAGSTLLPKAREILSLTAELKDSIHGGTPRRDPDCGSRESSVGSSMVGLRRAGGD